MNDEQDLSARAARGVRAVRRASAVVIERASRLGDAKDWSIVGAALCLFLAAILITAMWNPPARKRSDGPMTVVHTTAPDEIMVVWTRS